MRYKELILKLAKTKQIITRKDVIELLHVSGPQAYRLLKKLVDEGSLRCEGNRNTASLSDPVYRRRIIDVFVNSVYIFDDKIVFAYNFKDGTDTFSLKDVTLAIHAKSSDVADSASP